MTLELLVYLLTFGAPALGLVGAAIFLGIARNRVPYPPAAGAVRGWTVVGLCLALAVALAIRVVAAADFWHPWGTVAAHGAPLAAGLIGVGLIILPAPGRRSTGSADLSRRTLTSFMARGWVVALGAVLGVVLIATVAAGMASTPDDQGRFTMYRADFGSLEVGTQIYGWFYSVPCLILIVLLLATASMNAMAIARPPLDHDHITDADVRRWRTRNIVAVTTGALLLHLATILGSLAGTATVTGGTSSRDRWFSSGASFAALETPLAVLAQLGGVAGWFLWFVILLAALRRPARHRSRHEAHAQ